MADRIRRIRLSFNCSFLCLKISILLFLTGWKGLIALYYTIGCGLIRLRLSFLFGCLISNVFIDKSLNAVKNKSDHIFTERWRKFEWFFFWVCVCACYLWKAFFVHMVHHHYLIIIAGGGASWAESKNKKTSWNFYWAKSNCLKREWKIFRSSYAPFTSDTISQFQCQVTINTTFVL